MKENIEIFHDYAYTFDQSVKMIHYKYEHSLRVMNNSKLIAKSLALDEDDVFIAEFIGLTHDIGRFKQWDEYETYDDSCSFDHALKATEILFDDNLIKEFNISEKYYKIILEAIKNHNKFAIDKNIVDERVLMHSKIVRDADKLDILNAFSDSRILELKSDNSEISESVNQTFFNHKQTDDKKMKTQSDRIIQLISLIYDLNYECSFELLKEKKYLDNMYNNLCNKLLFKKYFEEVNNYIDERIDRYVR